MTTRPARCWRVRGVLVVLLLVPASRVVAHDLWILPGKYRLAPGETTRIFVNNGDEFPESLTLLGTQRVTEVSLRGPEGPRPITEFRVDGKSLTFDVEASVPGTYVVALGTHTRRVRMKGEDFRDYLSEEKLDEIAKLREEGKQGDEPAVEQYSKFAKTVLEVGDGSGAALDPEGAPWEQPVGHPIEIVPLRNPNRIEPGADLPVRVLFRGEPIAGVNVIGGRASGPPREITTRTDDNGEATVHVSAPGRWYLRALRLIPFEGDPEVQWESFWCTLTFESAPGQGGGGDGLERGVAR